MNIKISISFIIISLYCTNCISRCENEITEDSTEIKTSITTNGKVTDHIFSYNGVEFEEMHSLLSHVKLSTGPANIILRFQQDKMLYKITEEDDHSFRVIRLWDGDPNGSSPKQIIRTTNETSLRERLCERLLVGYLELAYLPPTTDILIVSPNIIFFKSKNQQYVLKVLDANNITIDTLNIKGQNLFYVPEIINGKITKLQSGGGIQFDSYYVNYQGSFFKFISLPVKKISLLHIGPYQLTIEPK